MNIRSAIYLLAHSSNPEDRREWAVLYWKSQGLKHEEIAIKLGYSIKWVQRYMTNAYTRFEVPKQLNKYEKLEYLEKNVFPLMREFIANEPDIINELPPPPTGAVPFEEDEEDGEDTSEEPPIVKIIYPKILPPPPDRWKTFRRVFFAVVSLSVVSAVGYFAYNFGRGATPAPVFVVVTATPVPATETPLATNTSVFTETPLPPPTFTPLPTNTPLPTATPFVPPADGVLFQDDFESGDLSAWTQYSGQWIVANGKLTMLANDIDSYNWIALDRPEWKNYIVSFNLTIPHQGSAAQENVAIAVRTEGSQPKYLGVPVDTIRNRVYWAFIEGYNDQDIAGMNEGFYFESGSNMQIEVQGDTYTLSVNGRELQKITMSGYNSGGISFGIDCDWECPLFDNIKVTYLP